jgi:formate hydrogenlyase subunit 6/NADH:ubiquinone oxidoreductase subunit I
MVSMGKPAVGDRLILERPDFPAFLSAIQSAGFRVVGPTVRDGAIVYGDIRRESDLPIGWTDRQEAGQYRLERRSDEALFGYNVGPHSWKKYLYPSRERLWTAKRAGSSFEVASEPDTSAPLAFLGVRACELAAIAIQDKVFMGYAADPGYSSRRGKILRIAVQCGQSGSTCFCVSMGTGPGIRENYDIALTEFLAPAKHRFLVQVGSELGAEILSNVPHKAAATVETEAADAIVSRTAASMGRHMDTGGIRDLLLTNLENPRWEIVAKRCLSCTNCTMACPTCFCSTTEEVPDLSGETVEKWRRWDSCFNLGFTELHLMSARKSTQSRYRQWLTHKLASWQDQFGTSGCVGCGRCITWCPVGIDITEEAAAIRATPVTKSAVGAKP